MQGFKHYFKRLTQKSNTIDVPYKGAKQENYEKDPRTGAC